MDLIKTYITCLKHILCVSVRRSFLFVFNAERLAPSARAFGAVACVAICLPLSARASSLVDLEVQKDLTPEALLKSFAGYTYELGEQVQDAETFLQRKRGDCDDFASLAESILAKRGFHAKLVVIMMARETHVVCYVKEAGGFLDFNFRNETRPVIESDGSLEDIATKVAGYFKSKWHMASEFKYQGERTVFVESAFPLATVKSEVARAEASPSTSNIRTLPVMVSEIKVP
jgi:hypothetical protein